MPPDSPPARTGASVRPAAAACASCNCGCAPSIGTPALRPPRPPRPAGSAPPRGGARGEQPRPASGGRGGCSAIAQGQVRGRARRSGPVPPRRSPARRPAARTRAISHRQCLRSPYALHAAPLLAARQRVAAARQHSEQPARQRGRATHAATREQGSQRAVSFKSWAVWQQQSKRATSYRAGSTVATLVNPSAEIQACGQGRSGTPQRTSPARRAAPRQRVPLVWLARCSWLSELCRGVTPARAGAARSAARL